MADAKKEYISILEGEGEIRISEDVICSVAVLAANEIPGVTVASGGIAGDIANLFGRKNIGKTVKVSLSEEAPSLDLTVTIDFGVHIHMATAQVQTAVAEAVDSMCGLKLAAVNIQVAGVNFEKPAESK